MIHLFFDILAMLSAIFSGYCVYRWRLQKALPQLTSRLQPTYFLALSFGSITGSFLLGSANLWVSDVHQPARSILGALTGATLTVELYKHHRKIRQSTGFAYVVPLTVLIIIGRLGCAASGLNDFTLGIATTLPWGIDQGDGVLRHPVALYESVSMALFLIFLCFALHKNHTFVINKGFYLLTAYYSLQRFLLEFLKPYKSLSFDLNLFQWSCIAFMIYSLYMLKRSTNEL